MFLPKKDDFFSHLKMEAITDVDYTHAKRACKDLKKKKWKYHYLGVQSDTLLLADVFENSRNMCLEVYEINPACFLTSPGLVWQVPLKKYK